MNKKKTKTPPHPALATLAALDALAEQMEPLALRLLHELPSPREIGTRRTDFLADVDQLRRQLSSAVDDVDDFVNPPPSLSQRLAIASSKARRRSASSTN